MSLTAAELGRKLLDEVHEAPLDEVRIFSTRKIVNLGHAAPSDL